MRFGILALLVLLLTGCDEEKDPNLYTLKQLVLEKCTSTGEYFNVVEVSYTTVGRGAQVKHETPTDYYLYDCPSGRKYSKFELKIMETK